MRFRSFLLVAAVFAGGASAHDFRLGELHIDHPYARPTAPGQTAGAAYMTIENRGKAGDKLLSATSPAAQSVEMHTMSMDGNVMKMRQASEIAVAPAARVVMQPGDGYHLMLLGLTRPLKAGDKLPLTLVFEKAGKTEVSIAVEARSGQDATPAAKPSSHHHGH